MWSQAPPLHIVTRPLQKNRCMWQWDCLYIKCVVVLVKSGIDPPSLHCDAMRSVCVYVWAFKKAHQWFIPPRWPSATQQIHTYAHTLSRGFPLILWWHHGQAPLRLWQSDSLSVQHTDGHYSTSASRLDIVYSWKPGAQMDPSIPKTLVKEINHITVFKYHNDLT